LTLSTATYGTVGGPRTAAPGDASIPRRADWPWLFAILLVAFALRAFHLNAGLWYDEIDTLVHYTRLPALELLTVYPSLNHHVLFTLEAKAAIGVFGESAWALRLPSLVFGVASVWALWLVAREIVSRTEALLASLMLAVSYHHVWFSQNARGYTGLLFWGLLATYFLIRAARTPSWRYWLAYAVVSALAIHTHLSAAFLVASHGLIYCGVAARRFMALGRNDGIGPATTAGLTGMLPLYGFALTGALALLLHAPLIPQIISTFTEVAGSQSPLDTAASAEWKSAYWMISEVARSLGPIMGAALPVIIVITAFGMADLRKTAPIVPALVLIHMALTLAVLLAVSMRVWPRYFFIDIGFICLFLVHGAYVIGRLAARFLAASRRWSVGERTLGNVLAAAGILASLVLLPRNYLYPKQDFVGARNFVEAHRLPNSAVVTLGLATMPYADYYAPQWAEVDSVEQLEALRQSERQVWLVYSFPGVTEQRYKDVASYLARKFERVARFPGTLGGGDVLVWRSAQR
jgi:mannosyltransferase